MCIYSQTTYSCKHNIETLIELCDLGRDFKPSMHDKVIIGIHESNDKCEACDEPHDFIDLTQDGYNPIDLTKDEHNHIDLTQDPDVPFYQDFTQDPNAPSYQDFTQVPDLPPYQDFTQAPDLPFYQDFNFDYQDSPIDAQGSPKKRMRTDSAFDNYPVLPQTDLPMNPHPAPMDTRF